ncbi:hypothetical protein ACQP1G_37075 [Nocardia sp. CA-107356]|uniref:hypothetical protein n=1 Tax=Nocardia sp. CA-107356 TaxID=3239972 RepID=UPI003D8C0B62
MNRDPDPTRGQALLELRELALGSGASVKELDARPEIRQHLANKLKIKFEDIDGRAARVILVWVVERAKNREEPDEVKRYKQPCWWDAPLILGALLDPFSDAVPSHDERRRIANATVPIHRRWKDATSTALVRCVEGGNDGEDKDFTLQFLIHADNVLTDRRQPIDELRERLRILREPLPPEPRQPPIIAIPPLKTVVPKGYLPRPAYIDQLDQAITAATEEGSAHTVIIWGPGGYGKTELARYWAKRIASANRELNWYQINLRGFDAGGKDPIGPIEALTQLAAHLGVAASSIAHIEDDGIAAIEFRRLCDSYRPLLILDNAATAKQVAPLLPDGQSYFTVVTGRPPLRGLEATHSVESIGLKPMKLPEAVEMLKLNIPANRWESDEALERLAPFACGLPRALKSLASLVKYEYETPTQLARKLRDRRALDKVSEGDEDGNIRIIFSTSYEHLNDKQQRAYRLLSSRLGQGIDAYTVSLVAGVSIRAAERMVVDFEHVGLIDRTSGYRFDIHDLLREFSREQCSEDERREAISRMLAGYYGSTNYAFNMVNGGNPMIDHAYLLGWTGGSDAADWLGDDPGAIGPWFATERAALVDLTIRACAAEPPDEYAPKLAASLFYQLDTGNYLSDWEAVTTAGLAAVKKINDPGTHGFLLRNSARIRLVRVRDALDMLRISAISDKEKEALQESCLTGIEQFRASIKLLRDERALPGAFPTVMREIADVRLQLAQVHSETDVIAAAHTAYIEAEPLFEGKDNPIASLSVSFADVYILMDDDDKARERIDRALDWAIPAPGTYRHANIAGHGLIRRAKLLQRQGNVAGAASVLGDAVQAFRSRGDLWQAEARTLARMGQLPSSALDRQIALSCLHQAEEIFRDHKSVEAEIVRKWIVRRERA